jgi:hypothetical protein
MNIGPIMTDDFTGDPRGPELVKLHWDSRGCLLQAIDFARTSDSKLMHLRFTGFQVYMYTPEEVINYEPMQWLGETRGVAAYCLGQSPWLKSFSDRHLGACSHYQLLFYDELVDVVCEGVEVIEGGYVPPANTDGEDRKHFWD